MEYNADTPYKCKFLSNILSHAREHGTISENERFTCHLHSPEKYQCEKCNFQSHQKVLTTNHFNTIHKAIERQSYQNPIFRYCKKCDFQTYSPLIYLGHNCTDQQKTLTKKEKKILSFQCDHCPYNTKRKGDLRSHITFKHTPSELINWFKCEHCSYKAKKKFNLTQHVLAHHTLPAKEFKCEHCSYKAKKVASVESHVLRKHTPSDWVKCKHCSYEVKEKEDLHLHVLMRHTEVNPEEEEKPKQLKCDHCSYVFPLTHEYSLKRHILSRHTLARKPYKCDQCPYQSKRSKALRNHIVNKHTPLDQISWFKCEYCTHKSKTEKGLNEHVLRKHSQPTDVKVGKPKLFKCDYCFRKFVWKTELQLHVVREHFPSEKQPSSK